MISYVKGIVAEVTAEKVIIENNGIGYGIFMPVSSLDALGEGEQVKIHTYYSVREDAIQLFGFLTKEELEIFKLLITVSGIGPKGGLAIISTLPGDELQMAIVSSDAKAIAKAPGVGLKTAQKVIIELKDKIDLESFVNDMQESVSTSKVSQAQEEAIQALMSLGFSKSDSTNAVKKIKNSENMDFEAIVTEALQTVF